MSFPIIGDLAQNTMLRRISAATQIDLARSSAEIATGRLADPARALGSAMEDFSAIERRVTAIAADLDVARDLLIEAEAGQAALGTLTASGERLAAALLGPATLAGPSALNLVAEDARQVLDAVTSSLNVRVGERSIFAGTAVGGPAIASGETLLDAIEADLVLSGAATLDDLILTVDTFFAPGGGFETSGYLGSVTSRPAIELTGSQTAGLPPRADDPDLRGFLAAATKAALLARDPLNLSDDDRVALAKSAGVELLAAGENVAALRARIGQTEQRASLAMTELVAEDAALQKARNDLIGVDPFQAATELASAEARLEKIYTITARLSRLSLADFLR